ncbi:MAG TPA: hypothetical protein VHN14_15815 [Kofleriaceae bacterium]|jgi:hypothetical protein|nr:hypothetical protein [Kofleriaceae bacterium]
MSLRSISFVLVAVLALGCGGGPPKSDEPTTAREKQRREAEAKGETSASSGKWGGWRYTGDRNDCFFVVGRRCFKTEAAACAAARCGKKTCQTTGGGPASVSCAK